MKAQSEAVPVKESSLDRKLNLTIQTMQDKARELLRAGGRNFPGKILLSRVHSQTNQQPPRHIRSDSLKDEEDMAAGAGENGGAVGTGEGGEPGAIVGGADVATAGEPGSTNGNTEPIADGEPNGGGGSVKVAVSAASDIPKPSAGRSTDSARVARFKKELAATTVDLDALRELSWSGVPPDMRPTVWRLLLGYAPPNADRRESVLARKRQEYRDCVPQYYDISNADRSDEEVNTLRQISVDTPRTVPDVQFFQQSVIQTSLSRILYIWAIRHPASGYVQGINDLVTPFLAVFLSEAFDCDMESWNVSKLPQDTLLQVEADCYWCLSKLLDGIQDHYTFAQPGIQRLVFKLKELVRRIDEPMAKHLEEQNLEYLQFAFRWFNCLLIREVPFHLVARLWDTYLAEGDGFAEYLVYVCASFLLTWTEQLQQLDFQEMVLFLQHLPTQRWMHQELEMVLSRAFMWRVMFDRSPHHLAST